MAAHKLAGANCKCSQAPEHIGGPLTAGDTPGTEHQHLAEAKQEEAEEEVALGPIVLGTSIRFQRGSELLEAEVPEQLQRAVVPILDDGGPRDRIQLRLDQAGDLRQMTAWVRT